MPGRAAHDFGFRPRDLQQHLVGGFHIRKGLRSAEVHGPIRCGRQIVQMQIECLDRVLLRHDKGRVGKRVIIGRIERSAVGIGRGDSNFRLRGYRFFMDGERRFGLPSGRQIGNQARGRGLVSGHIQQRGRAIDEHIPGPEIHVLAEITGRHLRQRVLDPNSTRFSCLDCPRTRVRVRDLKHSLVPRHERIRGLQILRVLAEVLYMVIARTPHRHLHRHFARPAIRFRFSAADGYVERHRNMQQGRHCANIRPDFVYDRPRFRSTLCLRCRQT